MSSTTSKKEVYKKQDARAKLLFCLSKRIAFMTLLCHYRRRLSILLTTLVIVFIYI